jgi:hypothetical protein
MVLKMKPYNSKNEELPVIGRYLHSNLKNDLPLFTAFSPRFGQDFLDEFDKQITDVENLVIPKGERTAVKEITARLHSNMKSLVEPLTLLEGYIKLAKLPLNMTDFGITAARRKITSKDAEGVLQQLQLISTNIDKHKTVLTTQGLTPEIIEKLTDTRAKIAADNLLQYEMQEKNKMLVQTNQQTLNELYAKIMEICNFGKILFRGKDAVKLQGYTFSQLLKKVRVIAK